MRCAYCGSNAHEINHCPKTWNGQINRSALRCDYCGSKQHNGDGCPKTAGGPNPIRLLDQNRR